MTVNRPRLARPLPAGRTGSVTSPRLVAYENSTDVNVREQDAAGRSRDLSLADSVTTVTSVVPKISIVRV
jgi:hypothetical protein